MKKALVAILFLSIGAGAASAATVFLPPFTYAGRVMNYMRVAYPSGVTVYARHTNGALLARASVFVSESSARNFALPIPLASVPTEQTAVVGETLRFEVDDGSVLWVDPALMPQAPVGNPGDVAMADIVLAYDSNGNGIADAYEAMIETLRFELLGVFGAYDPDADYDGDGSSNRQEYGAGTDPLSALELFQIDYTARLAPTIDIAENRVTVRFYAMRGRTYSVAAVEDLSKNPQWETQPFRLVDSTNAPVATSYQSPGTVAAEGNVTFYLNADVRMRSYRLRVE